MPKLNDTPESLRPYQFHGVEFDRTDVDDAQGDCPFCGNHKLSVRVADGVGRCWYSGCPTQSEKDGFNPTTFVRLLHKLSFDATQPASYTPLVENRGFLNEDVLIMWGVCQSISTHDWLVPGYNAKGNLCTLYRYLQIGDRMKLMPTPTLGHHLFGMQNFDPEKPILMVAEGPWDGMKLWEVMAQAKETESGLALTSNRDRSLLSDINVIAIAGCGAVGKPIQKYNSLFEGKRVCLLFDSDHPKLNKQTNQLGAPAGHDAMRRATGIIHAEELQYLHWGDDGYDPNLKDGFDVRDYLNAEVAG